MYLTASYQNSPGMIAGSREEVNGGSEEEKDCSTNYPETGDTPLQISGCSWQVICGVMGGEKNVSSSKFHALAPV